jgi:hypothetical protein
MTKIDKEIMARNYAREHLETTRALQEISCIVSLLDGLNDIENVLRLKRAFSDAYDQALDRAQALEASTGDEPDSVACLDAVRGDRASQARELNAGARQ